jgi:Bacterial lectin/Secretion system C-terminal sorting domain/Putative metal-binding motif/SprB repeat
LHNFINQPFMNKYIPGAIWVVALLFFCIPGLFSQSIVTVGNASLIDLSKGEYQLTTNDYWKAGSIWYQAKIDLRKNFTIEGEVYLGDRDAGADGIAFVLQPLSTNLGGAGVGIGYAGINPSVTVEMDTWKNCDPDQDHASIVLNGDVCHNSTNTPVGPKTFSANVEDGLWHHVIFKWVADTKTLQFFWDGETTPFLELTKDIVATVFGGAYYVYPGFTSGTGAERNDHRVRVSGVDFTSEGLAASISNASCSNSADGAIDLSVTGLTAPLSYVWSNGAITEDVSGLAAGNYKVTVTDSRVPAVSLLGSFDVGFAATAVTWYKDADNDSYSDGTTLLACAKPGGYKAAADLTAIAGDCMDGDATIYPTAIELCDTKDNDCDGDVDEGCPTGSKTWYRDADRDGYGTPKHVKIANTKPKRYVANNLDCKDWIPTVYHNAPELPDGLDNDCDGEEDEGLDCRKVWYYDGDGDGYGNLNYIKLSCGKPGSRYVGNSTDCKDWDANVYPGHGCPPVGGIIASSENLVQPKSMVSTSPEILVFPNPASTEINITLNGFAAGQKVELALVQVDGKVVSTQSLIPYMKGQQVRVDVRSMNTGYYLLQVKQGALQQVNKVLIVK